VGRPGVHSSWLLFFSLQKWGLKNLSLGLIAQEKPWAYPFGCGVEHKLVHVAPHERLNVRHHPQVFRSAA